VVEPSERRAGLAIRISMLRMPSPSLWNQWPRYLKSKTKPISSGSVPSPPIRSGRCTSACATRFRRSDARSVFIPLWLRSLAGRQLAWCRLRLRAVAKTEPLPYEILAPRGRLSRSPSAFVAARMSACLYTSYELYLHNMPDTYELRLIALA
jgi:hypothetical protein